MNPVALQKQLKDNANDLQDFFKDLKGWGDEMKRKEESLKKGQSAETKKVKLDPHKSPKKSHEKPKHKLSKIGSTDYAKWDRFDADVECEKLEEDINDDSELSDEIEESSRDEALVHKEKGNKHVKNQEWEKAIECYTKAIDCYLYDPIFYANRALCYLKLQKYLDAEDDCTLSLRMDKTYVKAFQRRAAAREELGKLEEAFADLQSVLRYEPKNKESTEALTRIRKKQGIRQEPFKFQPVEEENKHVSKFAASRPKKQVTFSDESCEPIANVDTSVSSNSNWPDPGCGIFPVKPIVKPVHLRSKKPLKRIETIEADGIADILETILEPPSSEPVKKHVVEHVKEENNEPMKTHIEERNTLNSMNHSNKVIDGAGDRPSSAFKKKRDVEQIKPSDATEPETPLITNMDAPIKTDITKIVNTKVREIFAIPTSSVQFVNTWKTLNSQDKYEYLRLIDPQQIPNIFRESLESKLFSSILEVLSTSFIEKNDNVYHYLHYLTQVKRFSTLAMFMDSSDKKRTETIISYLRKDSAYSNKEIDKLVLDYEL